MYLIKLLSGRCKTKDSSVPESFPRLIFNKVILEYHWIFKGFIADKSCRTSIVTSLTLITLIEGLYSINILSPYEPTVGFTGDMRWISTHSQSFLGSMSPLRTETGWIGK